MMNQKGRRIMSEDEFRILPKKEWTVKNIRDQFNNIEHEIDFAKQNRDYGYLKYYKDLREDALSFMTSEQTQLVYTDWEYLSQKLYTETLNKVLEQEGEE